MDKNLYLQYLRDNNIIPILFYYVLIRADECKIKLPEIVKKYNIFSAALQQYSFMNDISYHIKTAKSYFNKKYNIQTIISREEKSNTVVVDKEIYIDME